MLIPKGIKSFFQIINRLRCVGQLSLCLCRLFASGAGDFSNPPLCCPDSLIRVCS
ncbi:hypothetical protein [Photorhabdus heterorhabditis]|uniref:hypothetical protein n=1 Tax=Photorhabdus heterorhabditis TaxID=880156 RepID=UPI001C27ED26|nr:hypothetical protein [Photorhabdus heterorhabditis]